MVENLSRWLIIEFRLTRDAKDGRVFDLESERCEMGK